MDLNDKLHLHKVNKLEQLTPLELEQLAGDVEAKSSIAENQAFAELAALVPGTPNREAMLAKAFAPKEQGTWTPPVQRLPWWNTRQNLRWAISAALLMLVAGALVITPAPTHNGSGAPVLSPAQPAWASEPGLVMACDAETGSEEEALKIADKLMQEAHAVFELHSEEITKQEALLNEAIKALGKQRRLLGNHQPAVHSGHGLSVEEQASLKELQLNLTGVFEAIDLQSVELKRIAGEITAQETEVFTRLADLHSVKGKLSKIHMFAPRHEVQELENGMFEITVGFPGVELEPAQIAIELSGALDHMVQVSPAMFFVEKGAGHTGRLDHFTSSLGSHSNHPGILPHTVGLLHHAPSADIVRLSLAQSIQFVGGETNLEVTTESDNGRLLVTIARDGELLHEIESNDLGEGMVWFGMPDFGHLPGLDEIHELHLSGCGHIEGVESLDSMTMVVVGGGEPGETVVDLGLGLGGNIFELHGGGIPWLESYTSPFVFSPGREAALMAPGVVNPNDLHGKIISILGDAAGSQQVETLTVMQDGNKVVQVVVDGVVKQEIHLKHGDVKVVVVEGGEAGKEGNRD